MNQNISPSKSFRSLPCLISLPFRFPLADHTLPHPQIPALRMKGRKGEGEGTEVWAVVVRTLYSHLSRNIVHCI